MTVQKWLQLSCSLDIPQLSTLYSYSMNMLAYNLSPHERLKLTEKEGDLRGEGIGGGGNPHDYEK